MKKQTKSYFWTSYSDLMTSLFFVMLTLFALTVAKLEYENDAMDEELEKIREIEDAVKSIDPQYFTYDENYKKHVLNIDVVFPPYGSDIATVPQKDDLLSAGKSIMSFMKKQHLANPKVNYILVIEGQSSRDNYWRNKLENNDVLSYQRALSLKNFWQQNGVMTRNFMESTLDGCCEMIVSGSGQEGVMRVQPDDKNNEKNQRFLIHIMPKPGMIQPIK